MAFDLAIPMKRAKMVRLRNRRAENRESSLFYILLSHSMIFEILDRLSKTLHRCPVDVDRTSIHRRPSWGEDTTFVCIVTLQAFKTEFSHTTSGLEID
jgi:hypothetical protein